MSGAEHDVTSNGSPPASEEPAVLLMVEDSLEDAEAMRRAFGRAGIPAARIIHCRDAQEMLDYLERRGRHGARTELQLPRLMILDLNMPGIDGKQLLARIKSSEAWRAMPVVVLTSSTRDTDVESCYRLGANSYLSKPGDWEGMVELAERTKRYWFDTVRTPTIRR